MQLGLAMIFAKDMDRMTAFYRDAIGLELLQGESSDGWAIEILVPPKARGATPIKLFFRAGDLQEVRAHLLAHGAVMFEPAQGRCDGLDPEGNVFSIVT